MKVYITGNISFIATVAALVAHVQRMQDFNITNPGIFWGGQGIFIFVIMAMAIYVIKHWNNSMSIKKSRFAISVFIIFLEYAIAWIDSKYSWFFILLCGVSETYFIRRRSGFVKNKDSLGGSKK